MSRYDLGSILNGNNAVFIAELYAQYIKNPQGVDENWRSFFQALGEDDQDISRELEGASWSKIRSQIIGAPSPDDIVLKPAKGVDTKASADSIAVSLEETKRSLRALMLIRAYRVRGHLYAQLDPLGLNQPVYYSELDPKTYGFTDLQDPRPIYIDNVLGRERATISEIMHILQQTYSSTIGIEYMHIQDPEQKAWVQERLESLHAQPALPKQTKVDILNQLTQAEGFEKFLQIKYTGTKRFGLDGGESLIPAIECVLTKGAEHGVEEVVFGMAHRGRLNVLSNVLKKSFEAIFSEFQGKSANPEDVQGSGDVKYHLGTSSDRTISGKAVHLSLTANPSHLEAVNPVAIGKVRAKQDQRKDNDRSKAMCILLHGDAAFAGQGIVAETLMMSDLNGYRTGGTVHIIINNQIGFTTVPLFSRSGHYASDLAKMIQIPILHVNGDDPEAVYRVSQIATEFRQRFSSDVVIDMVCYRRHGHNEGDEPAFTQPLMYDKIKNQPTTRDLYAQSLIKSQVLSEQEVKKIQDDFFAVLEQDFKRSTEYKVDKADWLEGKWKGFTDQGNGKQDKTGLDEKLLVEIGQTLSQVPGDYNLHSKLIRQLKAKAEMFLTGKDFDWATAEAIAFGSLVKEGHHVRLSGQDCGRGTFSQRHAIMYDQTNESRYIPLTMISQDQAVFEVHDSPLSEAGVLGFEYGYSLAEPNSLVMWEAQFGDFVNGAQIIIDQFISSSEAKWLRMSGLVMLLPHGYEGNGPEHSSARLERFLQQCAENNMQVANVTTPANYFHILRRQVKRSYRKPLILMTPKSLLRHKLCVSTLSDMAKGTEFKPFLGEVDQLDEVSKVKRVVLCTGKVYYDLLEKRRELGKKDIAICRVEEIYPFPIDSLKAALKTYSNAQVIWCQEEPKNMGAWFMVRDYIEEAMQANNSKQSRAIYAGRSAAASPATGSLKKHLAEQEKLVNEALNGQ